MLSVLCPSLLGTEAIKLTPLARLALATGLFRQETPESMLTSLVAVAVEASAHLLVRAVAAVAR
jgi:hypothetical protein